MLMLLREIAHAGHFSTSHLYYHHQQQHNNKTMTIEFIPCILLGSSFRTVLFQLYWMCCFVAWILSTHSKKLLVSRKMRVVFLLGILRKDKLLTGGSSMVGHLLIWFLVSKIHAQIIPITLIIDCVTPVKCQLLLGSIV